MCVCPFSSNMSLFIWTFDIRPARMLLNTLVFVLCFFVGRFDRFSLLLPSQTETTAAYSITPLRHSASGLLRQTSRHTFTHIISCSYCINQESLIWLHWRELASSTYHHSKPSTGELRLCDVVTQHHVSLLNISIMSITTATTRLSAGRKLINVPLNSSSLSASGPILTSHGLSIDSLSSIGKKAAGGL